MNEIEIKDVQNVAQNMYVGSKQHSLFNPVVNNNPNLLSPKPEMPEMTMANIDITIKNNRAKIDLRQIEKPQIDIEYGCCSNAGGDVPTRDHLDSAPAINLNNHLYGILKPCKKQFPLNNGTTDQMSGINRENNPEF